MLTNIRTIEYEFHIPTHPHRYIYIYIFIYLFIYLYIHTYIYAYIHTYMRTYIHTYRHVPTKLYMYIDKTKNRKQLKTTILVRVEVCVYIYICILDSATKLLHFPLLGVGKIRNRYVCLLAADPLSRTVSLVDRALDQTHNHNQQPHME